MQHVENHKHQHQQVLEPPANSLEDGVHREARKKLLLVKEHLQQVGVQVFA